MKSQLLFFALSLSANVIICQNLKTYNGEYENGFYPSATAVYTYYEDPETHEYIKHGTFTYNHSFTNEGGQFNAKFQGNYKNNKKDGVWTYIIIETDCPHDNGSFYTGTTKLTASYLNGIPHGNWSYSYQYKIREKHWDNTWEPFTNLPEEKTNATFKNGHLIGNITAKMSQNYAAYPNAIGQFDDNGVPIGKWIFKDSKTEEVFELQNGIIVQEIVRELPSGVLVSQNTDDEELKKVKQDLIENKIKITDLPPSKFVIDTVFLVGKKTGSLLWFGDSFNNKEFKFQYIGGDDTYYFENYGCKDVRNYGYFLRITKSNKINLSEISDFNIAEDLYNQRQYKQAQQAYENIYNSNFNILVEADWRLLLNKIDSCKNQITKYNTAISKKEYADKQYSKVENWTAAYYVSYAQSASENYNELLTDYNSCFSVNDISSIQNNKNKCDNFISEMNKEKEITEEIKNSEQKMQENSKKIYTLYGVNTDPNGNVLSIANKEKLFYEYVRIYQDLSSQIGKELNDKLRVIDKIIKLQNRIIELFGEESKEIEKLLKKAVTLDDKLKILNI